MPLYILFSTWLKDIEWLRLNISEICWTRLELFYNVDMYMCILNYSNFSNIWLYYVIMIIIYDNFFLLYFPIHFSQSNDFFFRTLPLQELSWNDSWNIILCKYCVCDHRPLLLRKIFFAQTHWNPKRKEIKKSWLQSLSPLCNQCWC